MKITDLEVVTVSIPVKPLGQGGIAPYRGSRDPVGTSKAVSSLFKLTTEDGLVGWGEMSPIISPKVTMALVEDFLRPRLIGKDIFRQREIIASFAPIYSPHINTAAFASGVEMALWDVTGKALGRPVSDLFGGRMRERIALAYCFGITDEAETRDQVAEVRRLGYRALKTKGGASVRDDIERAFWLADAARGDIAIRVDMNQSYSAPDALAYLAVVDAYQFQYIEQPIASNNFEGLRSLKYRGRTPIAINEDAYVPQNILRAVNEGCIDAAVLDLDHAGGLMEVAKLAALADEARLPLSQHCGWDMGIKVAAILQLSAALPAFSYEMDSTYFAHAGDILAEPIAITGGHMDVPTGPGLGVVVDEDKIRHYRIA